MLRISAVDSTDTVHLSSVSIKSYNSTLLVSDATIAKHARLQLEAADSLRPR